MTTSNLVSYNPVLLPATTKHHRNSRSTPAGVDVRCTPRERCLRCLTDISHLWRVTQLCDDCLEWEISYLRKQNEVSE